MRIGLPPHVAVTGARPGGVLSDDWWPKPEDIHLADTICEILDPHPIKQHKRDVVSEGQ